MVCVIVYRKENCKEKKNLIRYLLAIATIYRRAKQNIIIISQIVTAVA